MVQNTGMGPVNTHIRNGWFAFIKYSAVELLADIFDPAIKLLVRL